MNDLSQRGLLTAAAMFLCLIIWIALTPKTWYELTAPAAQLSSQSLWQWGAGTLCQWSAVQGFVPAAMAFPWWFLPPWIDLTGFAALTLSPEHLSAKKFCGLAHWWQLLTKQCTGKALLHVNLSCIHVLGHVESVWSGFPAKALSHGFQVPSSWGEVEVVLFLHLLYPRISFLTGDFSPSSTGKMCSIHVAGSRKKQDRPFHHTLLNDAFLYHFLLFIS